MALNNIKLSQSIEKYSNELNEDVKLTSGNLMDKSMMVSSIWAKWLSYLFLEKENLERLNKAKQKLIQNNVGTESDVDMILRTKSKERLELDNPTMKKINELIKITNTNIDFVERALGVLSNFGFTVKNAIDSYRLQLQ